MASHVNNSQPYNNSPSVNPNYDFADRTRGILKVGLQPTFGNRPRPRPTTVPLRLQLASLAVRQPADGRPWVVEETLDLHLRHKR